MMRLAVGGTASLVSFFGLLQLLVAAHRLGPATAGHLLALAVVLWPAAAVAGGLAVAAAARWLATERA